MASTWATSWGTSWAVSWDRAAAPPAPPSTPSTGGGGGGYIWPGRRKGKSKQERLFDKIEATIQGLVSPKVHIGTDHVALPENVIDLRLEKALRELSLLAAKDGELASRYAQLNRDIAAHKELMRQREIDDDDDDFYLMSE